MEVEFTDSFFKSINKIKYHRTWWYKTYYFFRYDLSRFFRNLWYFRKEIWNFYGYDWAYTAQFMKRGLERMSVVIEQGLEVDETRLKKVKMIKRVIELLDNYINDNFIEQAEKILNKEVQHNWRFNEVIGDSEMEKDSEVVSKNNSEIFNLSNKLEKEQWVELWKIIQGQDYDDFKPTSDDLDERNKEFNSWFDGTGVKGWWE